MSSIAKSVLLFKLVMYGQQGRKFHPGMVLLQHKEVVATAL